MTVLVAVTDNAEGQAALRAASNEAELLHVQLVAINLTGGDLDTGSITPTVPVDVVVPDAGGDLDEVDHVLAEIERRSDVTRLVVGVRPRSPIGKAILGSIAQRLLLEAPVPVLAVKNTY